MKLKVSLTSFVFAAAVTASAQPAPGVLTVTEPQKLVVKRGEMPTLRIQAQLKDGYHANSHTPSEEFLIPLKLTWDSALLETVDVKYPVPKNEKYEFSEKPLSVVSGQFDITTKFKPVANPALGPGYVTGKLRYQACTEKMCLPPKTVEVKLPVLIQ